MMTNNQIKVIVASPIILEGEKIRLDQLLLSVDEHPLLEKTDDLYHASQSIVNKVKHSGFFIVSDDINPPSLPCQPKKDISIDTGSGVWQAYKRKIRYHIIDELVFYARGDAEYLAETIRNIGFLGAYTSIGFGEIAEVSVTQMEEDYSFINEERRLMRSIPVGVALNIDFGEDGPLASSYHESLEDCYNNSSLVLSYNPTQL